MSASPERGASDALVAASEGTVELTRVQTATEQAASSASDREQIAWKLLEMQADAERAARDLASLRMLQSVTTRDEALTKEQIVAELHELRKEMQTATEQVTRVAGELQAMETATEQATLKQCSGELRKLQIALEHALLESVQCAQLPPPPKPPIQVAHKQPPLLPPPLGGFDANAALRPVKRRLASPSEEMPNVLSSVPRRLLTLPCPMGRKKRRLGIDDAKLQDVLHTGGGSISRLAQLLKSFCSGCRAH